MEGTWAISFCCHAAEAGVWKVDLPSHSPSHTAQGWLSLFRAAQAQWAAGAQGTDLGQPKFCWLVAGKTQGKTLFTKRDVFLGVLPFQALLCTNNYARFMIHWWLLHTHTAADTSPCRLKGTPRTRRWSLLPLALTHTQTKHYQPGGQLHSSSSGFPWMWECLSNKFMWLFLQTQDSFSLKCANDTAPSSLIWHLHGTMDSQLSPALTEIASRVSYKFPLKASGMFSLASRRARMAFVLF